ncbi:MAG: hypothetical protein KatS3mg105_4973 [Gemmatales bacterium]|nr:MAG: hypothetical protein KatS3mg105_4973 [Gemmatales bacterium]
MSETSFDTVDRAGVGTHLHRLLAAWGFTPREGCFCEDRAAELDRRGPRWCAENTDAIVDCLVDEARQCQALGVLARIVPGPTRVAVRRLVLHAIALAEGGSE